MDIRINEIRVRSLDIPDIDVFEQPINSTSVPYTPPVTIQIGIPVVDMPGCVEAPVSYTHLTLPTICSV